MKLLYTLLFISVIFNFCISQNTYVFFHNNTNVDFTVSTTGSPAPDGSDWDGYNGNIVALQPHVEIMRLYRDWSTSSSSSGIYELKSTLTFPTGETVDLKMLYDVESLTFSNPVPRINISQSGSGPTFSHPWRNDRVIYDQNFTVNGIDYILRYQAYSTVSDGGLYDDVLFSIYEADDEPYQVLSTDLTDPYIFNVMSYNVFMRPTTLFPNDDQAVRADHIADYTKDMDAIILQEVFDNPTRATLLSNLAAEYPYQTTVVDDTGNALEDGGVVIVSRWPIETEDQDLWGVNCYEDDCLSNKGVKYARINKLGVKYHVFGTHMDAFNKTEDINVRKQQLVQWKNYIDSKSIPATEAVLMGGDYNIDRFTNKLGEYDSLWSNFNAQVPIYAGFYSTWDPIYNLYNMGEPYDPEFLDYVLSQNDHLNASSAENTSVMMRSNHIDMWRVFDLSDHYAVIGRFEFPNLLPVDFVSFRGWYDDKNKHNELNWVTATELNNEGFYIEKSIDGINFDEISFVEGKGDSQEELNYSYIDDEVEFGNYYYRLRQIDFDGTEELSEVVSIYVPGERVFVKSLYPNPLQNNQLLTLELESANLLELNYSITNLLGKTLSTFTKKVEMGSNTIQINTSDWSKGVYILRITDDNGEIRLVEKIIK